MPSVELCERGVLISEQVAKKILQNRKLMEEDPEFR